MNDSNINLNLYKTFYEVAKCSSFSKAAEKLYVTKLNKKAIDTAAKRE